MRSPPAWAIGAAACAAIAGCAGGGARPPAQAPVELAIAPIGAAPSSTAPGGSPTGAASCSLRLVGGTTRKSMPTCFLDEHLSDGPGLLRYPCSGDGPAEAQFGPHRYTGQIRGGEVELELSTEMDWEDGCRWGTHAVIRGTVLVHGQPARKKLAWSYEDRVLKGNDCSGVCTANASVEVQVPALDGKKRGASDDDGDDDDEEDLD